MNGLSADNVMHQLKLRWISLYSALSPCFFSAVMGGWLEHLFTFPFSITAQIKFRVLHFSRVLPSPCLQVFLSRGVAALIKSVGKFSLNC